MNIDQSDIKKTLLDYKIEVEKRLSKYLSQKTKEAYKVSKATGEMLENITDMTMRSGKRIRAALLYYSYLAHGGKDKEMAIKASMSLELAQTYLLIHDDIIDRDSLRRGGKTVHKIYEEVAKDRYQSRVTPSHYGMAIGILAGDTACGLSNEIIAELSTDPNVISSALLELNKMYKAEYFGQLLDINSEISENVKKNDIILVHSLKTSPYTFDAPIKLGAILAGATDKEVEILSKYAIPLGVAFQIQDDVLGMFGDEKKLGKPVVSDLREGKKTLLILDALARGNKAQKEIILTNLGNKSVSVIELMEVKRVVEETGALEESRKLAKRYVENAISGITNLRLEAEGHKFMLDIADYMVNRDH